jgi:uroporphyrinogen decarboxylase
MVALMTKRERVLAALRSAEVDRAPVSAWGHDYLREWSAEGLAQATLEAHRRYDWDFIKVNPRATYYAEAWGANYQPSGQADHGPQLIEPAVKSAADLSRIQPLDVTQGPFGQQLEALSIIVRELGGRELVIQTVFSPLAVMRRLAGSTQAVQGLLRDAPKQVEAALAAIAETLNAYARACLERGSAGIFFATVEWGSLDQITSQEYGRFARPFDLRVLASVESTPFNVLHVCQANNRLEELLDYPVAAFHWATSGTNPRLAHILALTNKAVMGGVAHDTTLLSGRPEAVAAEAKAALAETDGHRFLLAPGCSADPRTPAANLHSLRRAVHP